MNAHECYLRYREMQDNGSFTDLYKALANIKSWHRAKVLAMGAGDVYDADSTFDDALLSVASRDDVYDVCRLLYVYLRYARIKLYRKNGDWRDHTYYPESDVEFGATVDREEPDRAGFILTLVKRSNEPVAAVISDMALKTDGKVTISELANQAGTHHHAAFRSLRRLRRYYNPEIDGSLGEYLA